MKLTVAATAPAAPAWLAVPVEHLPGRLARLLGPHNLAGESAGRNGMMSWGMTGTHV